MPLGVDTAPEISMGVCWTPPVTKLAALEAGGGRTVAAAGPLVLPFPVDDFLFVSFGAFGGVVGC
jgi:hypothetical protein